MASPAGFLTTQRYLPVSYKVASFTFRVFRTCFSKGTGFSPRYQLVIMGKVPKALQGTVASLPSFILIKVTKLVLSIFGGSMRIMCKKKKVITRGPFLESPETFSGPKSHS